MKQRQPWPMEQYDEIRVTDNFGDTQLIRIPHLTGGHGGADEGLKDRIFRDPEGPDPFDQFAGLRDGTMTVLLGVAIRKSIDSGRPVRIDSLSSLQPQPRRIKEV